MGLCAQVLHKSHILRISQQVRSCNIPTWTLVYSFCTVPAAKLCSAVQTRHRIPLTSARHLRSSCLLHSIMFETTEKMGVWLVGGAMHLPHKHELCSWQHWSHTRLTRFGADQPERGCTSIWQGQGKKSSRPLARSGSMCMSCCVCLHYNPASCACMMP